MNKADAYMRASLSVLREEVRRSPYRGVPGISKALGVPESTLYKQMAGYEKYQMNASTMFSILALIDMSAESFFRKVESRAAEDDDSATTSV